MKGRSKAGGKSEKRRDRKTAKPKPKPKTKPKQSSGSHADVRRTSSGIRKVADVQQLIQERDAALDQQAATSEILEVISRSTGDLQPIFAAILQNAVRLCDASFGDIYSWERGALHLLANYNSPPAFAEERRRSEGIPPSPDRRPSHGLDSATKNRRMRPAGACPLRFLRRNQLPPVCERDGIECQFRSQRW
jgi:hypothetical protein